MGLALVKAIQWAFWNLIYLVYRPRDFSGYLQKLERCRSPWRSFAPFLFHCGQGRQWEIYLTDEPAYCERRSLVVDVYIGRKSGHVVGLIIADKELECQDS